MTQTTYRVTGKDRLSDAWVTEEFASRTEAETWAAQRAFVLPALADGREVLQVDASGR
jgi:hypothetical protein